MDIKAITVSRNGDGLTLGSVIDICSAANCQADANVVFDTENEKFLVLWEDARDGMNDYDIYGQLLDASGSKIGGNVLICNDANSQCEPWATYDPINEQYFIVWEDGINANDGPFRIRGGIFDDSLNDIWTGTIAEPSGYPNQDIDYNFPCVSFDEDSERFLVTWNDGDISDGDWRGNVLGKVFDTSGNVKVNQFTIKSGNFVRTDIVPYLSKAFFVSFDNGNDIFGKLVSYEGDLIGGDVQLSKPSEADADWANMDTDGSRIFVAWEDLRVIYPYPYDDVYPDAFGNVWNLKIPDNSQIDYYVGNEQQLILEAQITSIVIEPENLEKWHEFLESSTGTITFDILDEYGNIILGDVSAGQDLSGINPTQYPGIRLQAHFTRPNPSSSPVIYSWSVLYEGLDTEPPITWIEDIDGEQGDNDWYVSETVIVYFGSRDFPEQTGSGVNVTYYRLNGGDAEIYDYDGGLNLTTYPPDYWNIWEVNYWSVDNAGNSEDPEANYRTIKIDPKIPIATIVDPEDGEPVNVPFICIAEVEENAEMNYVEFDMEPWGRRPNLPHKDYTPPYEYEFNQWPLSRPKNTVPLPGGRSVKIRAWPVDMAGTDSEPDTISVSIQNWGLTSKAVIVSNFYYIFSKLNLGIAIDDKLDISIYGIEDVEQMKFVATKIFTEKQVEVWDNDLTNGCSATFDIPSGFYRIDAHSYNEGQEISEENVLRVFFINT